MSDSRNINTKTPAGEDALKKLDYNLQGMVENSQFFRACVDEKNLVPVTAMISDIEAWRKLTTIKQGVEIQRIDGSGYLVTARVPVSELEAVNALAYVSCMKGGTPVAPVLRIDSRNKARR